MKRETGMRTMTSAINPRRSIHGGWKRRFIFALACLVMVAAAVLYMKNRKQAAADEAAANIGGNQTWEVERGPMTISVLASGSVKAKNTTTVICEVRGDVKIIWIIEEGKVIKKGEKLVDLEATGLKENVLKQQVRVTEVQAQHDEAKENLDIQVSKNKSDLLTAENKLDMAKLDLEKYLKGDYLQELRDKETAILVAREELKRADDRTTWTSRLLDAGYVNRGELDADKLNRLKNEIALEKAEKAKELFEKYEKRRETSRLETAVRETTEELERIKRSNASQLRNRQISVESTKARLELEEVQLAQQEEQLANTVIYAPQDGMVVYAVEGGRGGSGNPIEVGTQVRNRQKLIELPDFSAWQIETRVHESMIQQVKLDQNALITLDAFDESTLVGAVSKIGVLPDNSRWFMPDTKEYLIDLDLTSTTLPLKPGMSAKTELILETLDDVLSVPIQSVVTEGGQTIVWVRKVTGPKAQPVKVGLNNDRFIEIREGLEEGDVVLMSPPIKSASPSIVERPSERLKKNGKSSEAPAVPASTDTATQGV